MSAILPLTWMFLSVVICFYNHASLNRIQSILTMVYDTQTYKHSGLRPLSRNKNWNKTFWKLDLSLSSGEGEEMLTLLGPLERANLNHNPVI
jgi:hypothetical protein